jgi:hypothetical protein
MAAWRPLKRCEFVRKLRALGFNGAFSGTRHQFIVLKQHGQTIPSNSEFSMPQIQMLFRQLESIFGRPIALDEWDSL